MTILSITIESCGVINNFVNDAIHIRELHKCRVNFKFNGVEVTLAGCEMSVEEMQLKSKQCKELGGEPSIRKTRDGMVVWVDCLVDGQKYSRFGENK